MIPVDHRESCWMAFPVFTENLGGSIGILGVIFIMKTNSHFNPLQKGPPDLSRSLSMRFLPRASPEVVWERRLNDHLFIYFTHSLNSKYMLSKTARGVKYYITPGLVSMLGQKYELGESGKVGQFQLCWEIPGNGNSHWFHRFWVRLVAGFPASLFSLS